MTETSATAGASPARDVAQRRKALALRLLTDVGLVLGGALALAAVAALVDRDGGLAYDTRAYWQAGRHVIDGTTLYSPATVSDLGAYKYPPIFAQSFVPAAMLPELVVAWLWRLSGILCLRYMVGSWKAALVAIAFIPVLIELSLGNVTLQIGAVLVFALRDRRGAYLLPWVIALKFGPALLVPYLWFRMPDSRRPLVVGTAVFSVACLVSCLVAPGQWAGYLSTFGWESSSVMSGTGVIAIVPSMGGLDFLIRAAIASVAAFYAVYARKAWLAYAAAAITCPILAFSRLAPLVALWRFRRPADRGQLSHSATAPDPAPA
jgi:hypothetical protein